MNENLEGTNDFVRGFVACSLVVFFMAASGVAGAIAAREWWPVGQEQPAEIATLTGPVFLPDKTRDAAVEMSKACIKAGKDVYWDTFVNEVGEAIHVACPRQGKPAQRSIAKTE